MQKFHCSVWGKVENLTYNFLSQEIIWIPPPLCWIQKKEEILIEVFPPDIFLCLKFAKVLIFLQSSFQKNDHIFLSKKICGHFYLDDKAEIIFYFWCHTQLMLICFESKTFLKCTINFIAMIFWL